MKTEKSIQELLDQVETLWGFCKKYYGVIGDYYHYRIFNTDNAFTIDFLYYDGYEDEIIEAVPLWADEKQFLEYKAKLYEKRRLEEEARKKKSEEQERKTYEALRKKFEND